MAVVRDEPFWTVLAVFDPDGGGADFAYTIGLVERGLPELHIWARPTHGDDPGADWHFSNRDLMYLLNGCAERMLADALGVGSAWSEQYDGGLTRADFVVGELIDRLDVDAYQTREDALVLPIRWSLHRPPTGVLGPISEAAEVDARAELREIERRTDARAAARLPKPWRPVRDVSFDPAQRYGPLTPLVVAAGAEIAAADAESLTSFGDAVMSLVATHGHRYGDTMIDIEARRAGRTAAVEAARQAAGEICRLVTGREASPTHRWRHVIANLFGDTSGAERRSLAHGLTHTLEDAVATHLSAWVVFDVASDATRRAGFGPWVWGLHASYAAPGTLWRASDTVLERVSRAVELLDVVGLMELGLRFEDRLADLGRDEQGRTYEDRIVWLRGMALTQPISMCDPGSLLAGTPAGDAFQLLAPAVSGTPVVPLIVEALSVITAAMAVAEAGSDHDTAAVLAPFADLLPELQLSGSAVT